MYKSRGLLFYDHPLKSGRLLDLLTSAA